MSKRYTYTKMGDKFAVLFDGRPADWPMLDTEEEVVAHVSEFNSLEDEDEEEGRGERIWQARMAGDMDA